MLRSIPAALFTEWIAYYTLDPFGEERADLRAGVLAALLANIHRDEKKQREPFEPADFFASLASTRTPAWKKIFDRMKSAGKSFREKA